MSFPAQVEAAVLAGGPAADLEPEFGERPAAKGMVTVGGIPMGALTYHAVRTSTQVKRAVLVSAVPQDQLNGPEWSGLGDTVAAGEQLMESFCNGVAAAHEPDQPMLICCGDLPLLTAQAVTDFVERCRKRPEASIWYAYLRKETSIGRYPEVPHTYAKLKDGTFCGTGMMMLRPKVVGPVREAMESLTGARKNMLKLAGCLGWSTVLFYALGRLTVKRAEAAGQRVFKVPCAGVELPFAEAAFNVDDNEGLRLARRLIQQV